MSQQYASQQPQGFKNHIENVAIVGAGGNVGKYFVKYLLQTGKHKVTAISREGSKATFEPGVHVKRVNYEDPESLASALQGQDCLMVTMGVFAPEGTTNKIFDAAATAKVPWIITNDWGLDNQHETIGRDTFIKFGKDADRAYISKLGVSSYISVACGFWYEYSLSNGDWTYGFDFQKKELTLFDKGEVKINTSTWEQCGRAAAALLSLKILPEDENDPDAKIKGKTLDQYRNNTAYISSFRVSQRDMLESVLRVTGDKESDWTITSVDSKERWQKGQEMMKAGNRMGFGIQLYTRTFWANGGGDYEATKGLHNEVLGLPEEDLDEWTKKAIEMSANPLRYAPE